MPEIEFWANKYGVWTHHQTIYYDATSKHVYSVIDCDDLCINDPIRYIERERVEDVLRSIGDKQRNGSVDFTSEETNIIESTQNITNFKFYDIDKKTNKTIYPAIVNLRHEFGLKEDFYGALPGYKQYRPYIIETLKRNGLPTELQYLPFVESFYDPLKVAPKSFATGLWQFMAATGKFYGLQVDSLFDDRRDPYKLTDAAAKYFIDSYKTMDQAACINDRNLNYDDLGAFVLTSYIYGPGIKNALKTQTDYMDMICNYKAPDFGPSTKGYFAKFVAASHVATHEQEYFGDIVTPHESIDTQTLQLSKNNFITNIAKKLSYTIDQFKQLKYLNLRYAEPIWRGKKPLPTNSVIIFPYDGDSSDILQQYGKIFVRNRGSIETIQTKKMDRLTVAVAEPEIKPVKIDLPKTLPEPIEEEKSENFFTNLFSKIFKQ